MVTAILGSLAVELPILLVALAGLALAATMGPRQPRAAALMGAGFALIILIALIAPVVRTFLSYALIGGGSLRGGQIGIAFTLIAILESVATAAAYALLIAAVLVGRGWRLNPG